MVLDATCCNVLESLEARPPSEGAISQPDAAVCRLLVPVLSPPLLTVREVARILKVSSATVYRLAARGELRHIRVSNAIRFAREDLSLFPSSRAMTPVKNGDSRRAPTRTLEPEPGP
jgi:excisionase family DNA binding protein